MAASRHTGNMFGEVVRYLRKEFRNSDLSLAEVSSSFGMHPSYLSRLFKKKMAQGFVEYITFLRLREAVRLLRLSRSSSVCKIALCVGFDDPYYFSKVFRRKYHVSPIAFRQRYGETYCFKKGTERTPQ